MKTIAGVMSVATAIFIFSCSKNGNGSKGSGTAPVSLHLTDAAGPFRAVYINLQGLAFNINGSWTNIPLTRTGLYNVVAFSGGGDTLISEAEIPSGTISQIKLLIGSGNYIVYKDGLTYPLAFTAQQQQGIVISTAATISGGNTQSLWLDFIAIRSITGNPSTGFTLSPNARLFNEANTFNVKGVFIAKIPNYAFLVYTLPDTAAPQQFADVEPTGNYFIRGMPLNFSGYSFQAVYYNDTVNFSTYYGGPSPPVYGQAGQTVVMDTIRY